MSLKSVRTLLLALLLLPAAAVPQTRNLSRQEYIARYKDIAVRQMNAYGIPASIILAQACLESGNGNSRLAVRGNNHFGIKCHNWTGKTIRNTDDQKGECFRRYDSAEESFRDHSEFLRTGRRYQSLFDLKPTDYRAWAHGLKACGYATDPQYAQRLIQIIEKEELYRYDRADTPRTKAASRKEAREQRRAARKAEKAARKAEKAAQRQARRSGNGPQPSASRQPQAPTTPTTSPTVPASAPQANPNASPNTTSTDAIPNATAGPGSGPGPGSASGIGSASDTGSSSVPPRTAPLKNSALYNCSLSREIFTDGSGRAYIISSQGDTYALLAKEYNLFKREILKFNALTKDTPLSPGTVVYITKPKK